jgi:hypothetical protein
MYSVNVFRQCILSMHLFEKVFEKIFENVFKNVSKNIFKNIYQDRKRDPGVKLFRGLRGLIGFFHIFRH